MKKATTTIKKTKIGSKEGKGGDSPSQRIDARIKELSDWRGETLARTRLGRDRYCCSSSISLNEPTCAPLRSHFAVSKQRLSLSPLLRFLLQSREQTSFGSTLM